MSFTDDGGNDETLTSAATDAVAAPEPPAKPTGLCAPPCAWPHAPRPRDGWRPQPIAARSLCARVAFSVLEGRPPRRFPRPRVRRLQPCTVPSAPRSADARGPDGLRPIPPHKDKDKEKP